MAKKQTKKTKKASPKPAKSKAVKKPTKKSTKTSERTKSPRKKDPRQRLQRVMAAAGIGSRRECELIIEEGRVEVDGEIVVTLGIKVDPSKQTIFVDAQELVVQRLQYFMLNKPPGILSTSKDPSGRPRVIDLIKTDKRVYNVGRLDQSSEGLILVTNDGDLAHRLTHPRYGVEKKYHVQVVGVPEVSDLRKLEEGVYIAEGLARATRAKVLKKAKSGCWLEIVLAEGRNREIRRMLAGIGHKVRTLKRVAIGPLKLGELPLGAHRKLTSMELKSLKNATDGVKASGRRKSKRKKPEGSSTRSSDGGKKRVVSKKRVVKKKKLSTRGKRPDSKSKTSSQPRRGGSSLKKGRKPKRR